MIQGSASEHLGDTTVALGVTGSVAAVQSIKLIRELRRHGAIVKPVATTSALNLIGKQALEWASEENVVDRLTGRAEHIDLAESIDLLLIAPATANTVAKLANGVADNALTALAASLPPEKIAVAPAMHLQLYENDAYRDNSQTLKERGATFVTPRTSEGAAKLAATRDILLHAKRLLRPDDLPLRIVITGGTTAEPLDDVRIVTTRASGKTGVALAEEAHERGADVTLVQGRGTTEPPRTIDTRRVETAGDMTAEVMSTLEEADAFICSAAISDHSADPHEGKLPSAEDLEITMEPIPKLIDRAREQYPDLTIVVFKAESRLDDETLLKVAQEKLDDGMDLVVVNDISRENAGFGTDENEVIIVNDGSEKVNASKRKIAELVLDRLT